MLLTETGLFIPHIAHFGTPVSQLAVKTCKELYSLAFTTDRFLSSSAALCLGGSSSSKSSQQKHECYYN